MYNRAGHHVSEVGALVAVFGTLKDSSELILKNIQKVRIPWHFTTII